MMTRSPFRPLIAFAGLFLVLSLGSKAWTAPHDPPTPGLAHIKLSGELEEGAGGAEALFGPPTETFKTKLDRITKARKDKNIKALYLQIDGLGGSWGKVNELRSAISEFRKSGKKAYAYLEEASTMDYLVAAACDEVTMPESGFLQLTGVRVELSFYKDLFEKVGLKADMMQMGDFKGAGETFTRSKISPENRQQWESVVDDFYNLLADSIAASRKERGFTPEKVKQTLDQGPFTAKRAVELGLIDRLTYPDAYQKRLTTENGERLTLKKDYAKEKKEALDLSNPFNLLKLLNPPKEAKLNDKPKIAVIYASGEIVTGKGGVSLLGGSTVGSTTMIEAIRKAEEEPTVKAIVLRVDSPGGSALASDLIWNEIVHCKKPVVASMSDVAASGGYYISMGCRKVYAEPGTITGSIGVVGGKIVLGGTYEKVGIHTEVISRGTNAGVLSTTTPFTDSERKAMRAFMEDVYGQFLDKAVEGRNKAGQKFTRASLEKLAGGRIWTGRQAKEKGLIDELGTLEDALGAAKELAGISKTEELEILPLPKSRSILDSLMDSTDTKLSIPKALQPSLPEISRHLHTVDVLLRLRGEPVWAIVPYRMEVR
jgi:protease-4